MPNGHIIVADDDAAIRTVLNQALSRAGYEVRSTGNCATLWRWVAQGEGDLVITDVVMPGMDGIELAQRAASLAPGMRVMFITGFAAVALKTGASHPHARVLSKPFHLRDLVLEVDRMFGVDSIAREP